MAPPAGSVGNSDKAVSVSEGSTGLMCQLQKHSLSVESGAFKAEVARLRPCLFPCKVQSQLEPECVEQGSLLFHSSERK